MDETATLALAPDQPSFTPNLLGVGSYGFVYSLSEVLVVKVKRENFGSADEFNNEQHIVESLGRERPYLLPYFYLDANPTFMLRAETNLRFAISSKQYRYDPEVGARWMGQICGGAVYLESKEMAHCDLRPDNILIDHNGNARLSDFGSALAVGKPLPTGTEPFARLLNKEDGKDNGTYGRAGPYTQNFALGSIYYSIIRGYYPHQPEGHDIPKLMDMYRKKEFAPLVDSMEDRIIMACWHGYYESVAELEQVFRDFVDGSEWYRFDMEPEDMVQAQRRDCRASVAAGGLAMLSAPQRVSKSSK